MKIKASKDVHNIDASDIADREGFYYDIKCEKCGTERQALYSEVTKNSFVVK